MTLEKFCGRAMALEKFCGCAMALEKFCGRAMALEKFPILVGYNFAHRTNLLLQFYFYLFGYLLSVIAKQRHTQLCSN